MRKNTFLLRNLTISVLLIITVVLSANSQNVGDKFKIGDLYYEITSLSPNEVAVVPQKRELFFWNNDEKPTGDISIPQTITNNGQSFTVTAISDNTFFDCFSLTSVIIPNSVISIGESAFKECFSLTSIEIPNSITTIGKSAFERCPSLTSITIPNSVTTIEKCVFSDCSSLTSIIIPNSVTTIGKSAFSYCTSLESITIPNSVRAIEKSAFADCTSLTSIKIPNSVTTIGNYAFFNCTSLTSVIIPNSVTTIEESAFSYCTSLTSIKIPNSVTFIGEFSNCTSLTSIKVDNGNLNYSSRNGVLFNKDKTELIQYPIGKTDTKYVIPTSVKIIKQYAFYKSKNLLSVTIPNSVKNIREGAFSGCSALNSILSKIEDIRYVGILEYAIFDGIDKNKCILYVPKGKIDDYKNTDNWKEFKNIKEMNTGIIYTKLTNPISIMGKNITISQIMNKNIKLYNAVGQVLYNLYPTQDNITLSVKKGGMYIVQVENGIRKVIVR